MANTKKYIKKEEESLKRQASSAKLREPRTASLKPQA